MEFLAIINPRSHQGGCGVARVCCAGGLLASLLVWAGCSPKAAKSEGMAMEFRVPITVAKATVENVPVQVEAIGNVEAYSNVSVRTLVAGEIQRAYFNQGDNVKKGQLLFTLDRRPFQIELDQLEANLARDEAQLANARAQAERNGKLF